ncbi:MAG: hypothetical protein ACLQQ4_06235 [Bacteroidia bacterium]
MKTLVIALSFGLLSIGAFAQQSTTTKTAPAKTAKVPEKVSYRCPVCGATSDKTGECPKDKVAYVKVGDYYCPDCYMSSSKPGKCTMCGVDMKKMEASAPAKK